MAPVQVRGEVLSIRRVGDYHALTLVAPGHRRAAPGPGTSWRSPSAASTPRCCCAGRSRSTGSRSAASTAAPSRSSSPSTARAPRGWPGCAPHDPVDVVGPLGRPFALPKEPVTATLVGGGYGSAPLFTLAEQLRARGCRVDFVLGAATEARLFGALEAKRMSTQVAITTEDGSLGERGRVTDVLPGDDRALRRRGRLRLRPDGDAARGHDDRRRAYGAHSQCAVEESMACGIGVCMTCVLPVVGDDGADPHGALLRRGPGVPRRPGALGRRRHRAGRHASARPRRWRGGSR